MKKKNYWVLIILVFMFIICPDGVLAVSRKVSCGGIDKIPQKIPELFTLAIRILQVLVPIILVVVGSIDLAKSVAAGKEDDMKKYRGIFIKKLILAAIVFFVIAITKLLVSLVADATSEGNTSELDGTIECIDCFTNCTSKNCNACK